MRSELGRNRRFSINRIHVAALKIIMWFVLIGQFAARVIFATSAGKVQSTYSASGKLSREKTFADP